MVALLEALQAEPENGFSGIYNYLSSTLDWACLLHAKLEDLASVVCVPVAKLKLISELVRNNST